MLYKHLDIAFQLAMRGIERNIQNVNAPTKIAENNANRLRITFSCDHAGGIQLSHTSATGFAWGYVIFPTSGVVTFDVKTYGASIQEEWWAQANDGVNAANTFIADVNGPSEEAYQAACKELGLT